MYILYKFFLLVIFSLLLFKYHVVLTNEESRLITSLDLKLNDSFYSPEKILEHKSIINVQTENHKFKDQQKRKVNKSQKSSISKKILKKPPIKKPPIKKPPIRKPQIRKPPIRKPPTKKPISKTTKRHTTRRLTTKRRIYTSKRTTVKSRKPITTTRTRKSTTTTPKPDKYAKLKSKILEDINKLRKKYRSPPLKINTTIAKETQNYATDFGITGGFIDRYQGPLGEIFYFAYPNKQVKPLEIWTRDEESIDFDNIERSVVNPQLFQLLWKSTRQIGIGVYQNKDGTFVFCRFYPKGNVRGEYDKNILEPLKN